VAAEERDNLHAALTQLQQDSAAQMARLQQEIQLLTAKCVILFSPSLAFMLFFCESYIRCRRCTNNRVQAAAARQHRS
jgi:hypothetical protein